MSVEKQDFLWETQQVTQISKQTLGWKQEGCHDVHLIPDNRNTVLTKEALECLCAKERERERRSRERKKQRQRHREKMPDWGTPLGGQSETILISVLWKHTSVHTPLSHPLFITAASHRIEEKPIWCTEEQNSCVIVPMFWTYVVDDLFFFSGMLNRELSLSACTLVLRSSSSDSQFLFIFFISFWN